MELLTSLHSTNDAYRLKYCFSDRLLDEDGLLEYVVNTRSTAVTFTDRDVTPGVQHVYRVQAISAEDRSQRSNYVNVTP